MPGGVVREIIPASRADVFELLHDYERRLEWDTLLSEAYLTDGFQKAKQNATSLCRGRWYLGGVGLKTVYVSFKPPRLAAVKMINRPMFFQQFAASIQHEEIDASTSSVVYKYRFTARPRILRFAIQPAMNTIFRLETRKRLKSLRLFFECCGVKKS